MVTVDALQWASRQPFKLATRATHSKAWVVERHDEILRNALHTCQTLLAIEGRDIKLSHALAGCVFSTPYLALLSIGAGTPYIALYGRVPPPNFYHNWNISPVPHTRMTQPASTDLVMSTACGGS